VPHPRFVGTSECGTRGDAIHQLDDSVGKVLAKLDALQLTENTIVIFSSDNGPVLDDGYADGAVEQLNGHRPAGPLKGSKYSMHEAGTRVPFILRWPKNVKPGESSALVCQIDLLNSLAALLGQKLPDDAAPDSFNILPALLGETQQGRETLVEHAQTLALREANWKYIPSLAQKNPGPKANERGVNPKAQLYNLANDLGETKNIATDHAERVANMQTMLDQIRNNPRSRP
jgi:arylsulfatase A-like enzyme